MTQMNFSKNEASTVLSSLNWATAEEDYTPGQYFFIGFIVGS
jgi:hypothetical protein